VIAVDEPNEEAAHPNEETSVEWAERVTAKMSGLLKEEMTAYGGGDAFIRWVRGYDEGEDDPWVIYGMTRLNQSGETDCV
jgi:hypothetical protein